MSTDRPGPRALKGAIAASEVATKPRGAMVLPRTPQTVNGWMQPQVVDGDPGQRRRGEGSGKKSAGRRRPRVKAMLV